MPVKDADGSQTAAHEGLPPKSTPAYAHPLTTNPEGVPPHTNKAHAPAKIVRRNQPKKSPPLQKGNLQPRWRCFPRDWRRWGPDRPAMTRCWRPWRRWKHCCATSSMTRRCWRRRWRTRPTPIMPLTSGSSSSATPRSPLPSLTTCTSPTPSVGPASCRLSGRRTSRRRSSPGSPSGTDCTDCSGGTRPSSTRWYDFVATCSYCDKSTNSKCQCLLNVFNLCKAPEIVWICAATRGIWAIIERSSFELNHPQCMKWLFSVFGAF